MVIHQGQFARAVDASEANYRAEVKHLEARFSQLSDAQLRDEATQWEGLSFGGKAIALLTSFANGTLQPSLPAKVAAGVLAARAQQDTAQTDNN